MRATCVPETDSATRERIFLPELDVFVVDDAKEPAQRPGPKSVEAPPVIGSPRPTSREGNRSSAR